MTTLNWQLRRNIENSLTEFLQTQAIGVTVFYKGSDIPIDIRVGKSPRDNWKMPVISIYMDTRTAPRGFVGGNKRLKSYLMIIDVRALDDGMRSDIAEWVTDTINEGFSYFDYQPNSTDPENPIKTLTGKVSVEFITDNVINAGIDADLFDKFRHNISISLTIAT